MVLNAFFNGLFSPFLKLDPAWGITSISFLMTLVIVLCYKFLTNQTLMKGLKEEIKTLQQEMKQLKDNPSKFMELQKLAMSKNLEYMRHSMKPTLYTLLPLLLIFGWLRETFSPMGDLLTVPVVGWTFGWLGTYIIVSIISSILLRKLFKVH